MINQQDRVHLKRCLELATEALAAGDAPFGSVLVSAEGKVLFEDRNRIASGDHTQHPEFAITRWAAQNMNPDDRAKATVPTPVAAGRDIETGKARGKIVWKARIKRSIRSITEY